MAEASARDLSLPAAEPVDPWDDAWLAAAASAVDPTGLVGLRLRAHHGAARQDLLETAYPWFGGPVRRLPCNVDAARLQGGLDWAASLREGRPVVEAGLLSQCPGGLLVLAMAERWEPARAALIAAALDGAFGSSAECFALLLLDESEGEDEDVPLSLAERVAFDVDVRAVPAPAALQGTLWSEFDRAAIVQARARLGTVVDASGAVEALAHAAAMLDVRSLRAPLFALRAARALAALRGSAQMDEGDLAAAVRLVLVPRARCNPARAPDASASEPPPPPSDEDAQRSAEHVEALKDIVLEAALATLPPGLLERLAAGREAARAAARASAGRSGALRKAGRRGRPVGSVVGVPGAGDRLRLVDTLRAAAPWQPLRRAGREGGAAAAHPLRLLIERQDLRIARFEERRGSTTIFVVDASGSAALHRLAEAKGAVELLLADCYARRDRVAVLAFRGSSAQLLLPPTRSLVRAKRALAGLPGGGGTPLAQAIDASAALAASVQRAGDSAWVVMLSDGRANVARDGAGGRDRAHADALASARRLSACAVRSVWIDTSDQPQPRALELAHAMGARYLPLPRADAARLAGALRQAPAARC
jgi:magnesium chelatase subunit D